MNLLYPHEAERGVIGLLVNASDLGAALNLAPADFSDKDESRIFAAMREIAARREVLHLDSIDEELTRAHGVDTAARLMGIVTEAMSQYPLQQYRLPKFAESVHEGSRRRKLQQIAQAIARGAEDGQRDLSELTDSARDALRKQAVTRGGWVSASEACHAAYEAAEQAQKPIPTGMSELDAILCGGLHRGEFTVLGARPAVGKSAVLLQMALNAAAHGARVAFVSLEMSVHQIGARMIAAETSVNSGLLRSGQELPEKAWADMAGAMVAMDEKCGDRLRIIARGALTVEDLRGELQTVVDNGGCDLLIVDYLQLLRTRQKTSSDFERVGAVSRALKAMTLDFGFPVVAAAQVRRQNNGGVLRAPGMDELRGSGDIEQDADNVLLLHRPETPEDGALKTRGYAMRHMGLFEYAQSNGMQLQTIEVAKQRQGRTARTWFVFNPARMQFINPSDLPAHR